MSLYNIEEAAELAGVPYRRLWYYLVTGQIKEFRRVGRIRLFDDCAIVEIREFFGRKDSSADREDEQ